MRIALDSISLFEGDYNLWCAGDDVLVLVTFEVADDIVKTLQQRLNGCWSGDLGAETHKYRCHFVPVTLTI
jgi:hypothetical protein